MTRFVERAIRVRALVLTRRLLTGLLLLAVLVAPACSSGDDEVDLTSPTATRPTADAPVTTLLGGAPLAVVLGDSNTFASAPELESALADAGLTPDVRGISGSGLKDVATDWLPAAAAVTAGQPAVTVIALGTNDAVNGADADAFAGRAEQLLARARSAADHLGDAHGVGRRTDARPTRSGSTTSSARCRRRTPTSRCSTWRPRSQPTPPC